MRTGPAIALRTCSTCIHWSTYGTVAKGEHVIKARCHVHDEIKSGGEKCSKWKSGEPK